ncbi:phage integrase N-terminal SAM-like domain-containing protein [Clostridium estertheticum]|uniref:Phage integrase N-terminal SAM-like domain-containing protein n=1 Tax=Clostridium estertheticum TaxID=238834 RepID=A0AA47ELI2_9CLOT|nr:phage integrase N-terminal SAM-like domain-containing protein [Clostridium estertheticum]MBU3155774.1 phage integrase N-terminal SAM-like domain-containing protein [Clostridium estertheticum]WAG62412.1 phage integrase N-terminal SAM-like domain-containing protein [Clostridium estertheticum]
MNYIDKNLSHNTPKTIKNYIRHISDFAKYYNKSPELLREKEIHEYLHYCIIKKKLSESTVNYMGLLFIT